MSDWNLAGKWNEIKGRLKADFGQLTDDDLTYTEGKEDELMGSLQHKLGKTYDEIKAYFQGYHKDSPQNNNTGADSTGNTQSRG